jgi:hypothetical protein
MGTAVAAGNRAIFAALRILAKQYWLKPQRAKNDQHEEPYRRLLLLPKHLLVGLAIEIKAIKLAAFPSGFQFGPVMSQSGRDFLNTARKSCRSASMVGWS